jgi:hypothetical protein
MAGALGVALVWGMGKMIADMKKSDPGPPQRRKPWELD